MAIVSRDGNNDELWSSRIGSLPLFITLLLPLIIGVVILFKCLLNHCCIGKTTTKEELFGVEGRMTILPTSENELTSANNNNTNTIISTNNNNSRPSSSISILTTAGNAFDSKKSQPYPPSSSVLMSDIVDGIKIPETETNDLNNDSLRATVTGRQLPDPPQSLSHAPRRTSSILSQDGASELYATVDEVPGIGNNENSSGVKEHLYSKVIKLKNSRPGNATNRNNNAEPNPSSDSETYAGSIHNPHHPYAKLKRPTSLEHPYAKVGQRKRTESTGNGGDEAEETDTDNYDVTHTYAQINRRRQEGLDRQQPSTSRAITNEGASTHNNSTTNNNLNHRRSQDSESGNEESAPVPPRRVGRQWRRNSQTSDGQNTNEENPALFSGDSQDSRGYSHLSVREPLSTIKAQSRKNSDPNYAFVSDDSEDLYAAIDDPADANYMSIQERPSWMGPSNLVSPIPERREQNSPLPPTPIRTAETPPPPSSSAPGTAIYAQVTKRKKGKAPLSPTEVAATHSKSQQEKTPTNTNNTSATANTSLGQLQSEPEPRRWSKAEISYAEFEVVRENIYPAPGTSTGNTNSHSHHVSHKHRSLFDTSNKSISKRPTSYIDEDNYDVIPETRPSTSQPTRHSEVRNSLNRGQKIQEDLYQEIDEFALDRQVKSNHSYQEVGQTRSSSNNNDDHYNGVGVGSNRRRKRNKSNEKKLETNPYQKISRKNTEGEDSDDEDEDGFYEKVKSKPRVEGSQVGSSQPPVAVTASGNGNMNKKHGYEKLKPKQTDNNEGASVLEIASDDDDDENGLYEKIKKPSMKSQPAETKNNTMNSDFHNNSLLNSSKSIDGAPINMIDDDDQDISPMVDDVDQLYARVDKTKKKKKEESEIPTSTPTSSTASAAITKAASLTKQKHNDHEPSYSKIVQSSPKDKVSGGKKIGSELVLSKDVTIEYI